MSARTTSFARIGKRAAIVVSILAIALLLTAILAIMLETPRTLLLRFTVDRIAAKLTPELHVESVRWPALGSIAFENVSITEDVDTLFAADTAAVSIHVTSLLRRDLNIEAVTVTGIALDLARLQQAFASERDPDSTAAPKQTAFFPLRPGAIETIPSARLGSFTLSGTRLDLGGAKIVNFRMRAAADNRAGTDPAVVLRELSAEDADGVWRVESGNAAMKKSAPVAFEAVIGIAPDNRLRVEVGEERAGEYALAVREIGADGAALDTRIEGTVAWEAGNGESPVRFDLRGNLPDVERLRGYAPLAPSLAGVPDLAGFPFTLDGQWTAVDGAGAVTAGAGPNGWMQNVYARVAWGGNFARVDSLALSLDGIEARGSFALRDGIAGGRGRVAITSLRGLAPLLGTPADSLPPMTGSVTFESNGPLDSLVTKASIRLTEVGPAPAIRRLDIDANHARPDGAIALTLSVASDDVRADVAARTDESFALVTLGPIRVLEHEPGTDAKTRNLPAPAIGKAPAQIRIDRDAGSIAFSSLRVTGDFGQLTLDGSASSERASANVAGRWPEPPAALVRRIEAAARDTLQARWSRERPFVVDGSLEYRNDAPGGRANAKLDFELPGPSVLSPALPVESGRRLAGRIAVDGTGLDTNPRIAGSLTVRPDGWIDSLAAHGFVDGEVYGVDSALVVLRGLRVHAAGLVAPDSLRMNGTYLVTTEVLDFLPDAPPVDSLRVEGQFVASGASADPDVRVTLDGTARGPSFAIDSLAGNAERVGDSLIAALRFGAGSFAGAVSLDRASAGWRGPFAAPYLPGRITIDAAGPELRVALDAVLDRDESLVIVRGDSLGFAHTGQALGSTRAFEIRLDPESERLTVENLDLAGSMGSIRVDGFATPDSADLTAHVSLAIPEGIAPGLPAGTVPDRIELDATARGPERITLTARADGLDLGSKKNVSVRVELDGTETGIVARMSAGNPADEVLTLDANVPIRTRVFPPALTPFDGPLAAEVRFDALPIPLPAQPDEPTPWAETGGTFTISGSASRPAFEGSASIAFPSLPNLRDHRVLVETRSLESGGVEARVDVERSGRAIAEATLRDPTRISLYPFEIARDSTGTLFLDARTQELRLEDYSRWFPAGSSAEGDVQLELGAEGPVGNPVLSGTFRTKQLNLKTSDRSQVRGRGELRLSGTRREPRVRGEVTIDRGVLRIPEDPQYLLPAEGSAALWEFPEYAARESEGPDSAAGANGTAPAPPSFDPDVEVNLSIPSGLWIRGQGLDVELSGDLSLGYKNGAPAVTGELGATRGTFVLLGRTFRMESGSIVFYGDKELNPALDIRLAINLEGTLVRLAVGGTLYRPELTLTSEPPMPEGDIMSFLLFGRPLEELNNNQVDLVQRRATDIATVFGTGKLEAKLADQLGVDMVRIRSTSGDTKGSSLVLGKYVSRKVLLEYEQALESNVFFISLDYILSRHFRVRTLYGQSDQSGMEVNWFNEY